MSDFYTTIGIETKEEYEELMALVSEGMKNLEPKITAGGSKMNTDNMKLIEDALQDVELTEDERKSLEWLSGWEKSTVENIVAAFRKVNK